MLAVCSDCLQSYGLAVWIPLESNGHTLGVWTSSAHGKWAWSPHSHYWHYWLTYLIRIAHQQCSLSEVYCVTWTDSLKAANSPGDFSATGTSGGSKVAVAFALSRCSNILTKKIFQNFELHRRLQSRNTTFFQWTSLYHSLLGEHCELTQTVSTHRSPTTLPVLRIDNGNHIAN